jgi:hypothetical protein
MQIWQRKARIDVAYPAAEIKTANEVDSGKRCSRKPPHGAITSQRDRDDDRRGIGAPCRELPKPDEHDIGAALLIFISRIDGTLMEP